jgi:hypothetical protein
MIVPLRAVVSSISSHRCTPLYDIIFYLAPLAILSSILPHGRAPLVIPFSIQPYGHAILAKYFSIRPHGCTYPGSILLLITYQGFLQVAFFCELPWCPFLPDSSRLPFIGFGVAFLAMPCDEQPFASFLMLSLKAPAHRRW